MIDLSDAPVSALLELHGDLLAELRRRNVIRSSNNPTGDYGELLFSRAFGWTLNGNSSADADALDTDGMRSTTIIGHMTGRQLQRRPGYEIDIDKILKACAEYGVAVEINAHPWRLDLDWRWHQMALDYGCIFNINPDAHSDRRHNAPIWNGPRLRNTRSRACE